jgi:hypothetical protein
MTSLSVHSAAPSASFAPVASLEKVHLKIGMKKGFLPQFPWVTDAYYLFKN